MEETVTADDVTGIDDVTGMTCGLTSYARYKAALAGTIDIDTDKGFKAVEEMILLGAIYGESRKEYKKQLAERFPKLLSKKQIDRIAGFNQQGWGNLSEGLLRLSGVNKKTGEVISLIKVMWEEQLTLNELLGNNSGYTFAEELAKIKADAMTVLSDLGDFSFDGTYFSAPVRKTISQAIKVIRELVEVMGCPPERIFLESTREEGVKGDAGRVDSRKDMLIKLFTAMKDEIDGEHLINLTEQFAGDGRLKKTKYFLYLRAGKGIPPLQVII